MTIKSKGGNWRTMGGMGASMLHRNTAVHSPITIYIQLYRRKMELRHKWINYLKSIKISIIRHKYINIFRSNCRIQDFTQRGRQPQRWVWKAIIWPILTRKLHKDDKKVHRGRVLGVPPLRYGNEKNNRTIGLIRVYYTCMV